MIPRDVWQNLTRVRGDGKSLDAPVDMSQYANMLKYLATVNSGSKSPVVEVEEVPDWVLSAIRTAEKSDAAYRAGQVDYVTEMSKVALQGPERVSMILPYQMEGALFGLKRGGRCLIADEMGLGKTLQAIMVAYQYRSEWPLLVVCPSSIRFVWREQLSRWLGGLIDPQTDIQVVTKGKEIVRANAKIVIVSYILVEPNPHLSQRAVDKLPYKAVICDESHYIKDPNSKRSKAVQKILKKAQRIILLSGTPSMNNAEEMYPQLIHLLPTSEKPSLTKFRDRYCVRSEFLVRGYPIVKFSGARNKEELFALLSKSVMIRRMKQDVLTQLPDKIRHKIDLDVENSIFAKKVQEMTRSWLAKSKGESVQLPSSSSEYGVETMELWRLTGQAKLAAVKDYLNCTFSGAPEGFKCILFAHHKFVMQGLEDLLVKEFPAGSYVRIDGEVAHQQRADLVRRFQTDPECKIALLSITSCSEGITLTAASVVIFCELYWVPGLIEQAEARAHRVGQKDCVMCYYLVMPESPDEIIFNMLEKKKKDTSAILDGTASGLIEATPPALFPIRASGNAQPVHATASANAQFEQIVDDDISAIAHLLDDESAWIPTSADTVTDSKRQKIS